MLSGLRRLPPRQTIYLVPGTHVGRGEATLKKLSFVFHVHAVACAPPRPPKKGKVKVTAAVLSFGMLYNSQLMPDRKLDSEVNRQIEKKPFQLLSPNHMVAR